MLDTPVGGIQVPVAAASGETELYQGKYGFFAGTIPHGDDIVALIVADGDDIPVQSGRKFANDIAAGKLMCPIMEECQQFSFGLFVNITD